MIDDKSKLEDDIFDYTMEDVLDRLSLYSLYSEIIVYVYNLSFEWSFIFPVLIQDGFHWVAKPTKTDAHYFTSITNKTATSVWMSEIRFSLEHHKIVFRDLAKIFPGGLAKVAETFGLETQKGSIDFTINRLHNYVVSDEEREYCYKDVKIVMEILERMGNDEDFWDSISLPSYSANKLLHFAYPKAKYPHKCFRKDNQYPELGKEESDFVRKSIEGGLTYVNPFYQFKTINAKVTHIDAKQMHPSSAYLNLFPHAKGHYGKGKPNSAMTINCCHVLISYSGVKLWSNVKLIGEHILTDYEMWVWDFEIPLMKRCYYDFEIKYIDYYSYGRKLLPWRNFYRNNFEKRVEAKKKGDLYNAQYYKNLNNAGGYGKFMEAYHAYDRENYIDKDGLINSIDHPKEDKINARFTYLPVSSCIPAYSRVALIRLALRLGYKNCIYFDTDSIFFLDNEETRAVMKDINFNEELGGWGIEGYIDSAQFTAPKRYKIIENGKLKVKTAGFQVLDYVIESIKKERKDIVGSTRGGIRYGGEDTPTYVPFDEINIVSGKYMVTRAYRVKGGTMIDLQEKEMEVQNKYKDVYEANKNVIIG